MQLRVVQADGLRGIREEGISAFTMMTNDTLVTLISSTERPGSLDSYDFVTQPPFISSCESMLLAHTYL